MSNHSSKQSSDASTFAGFWHHFSLLPLRFDGYGFDNWYLLAVGFYFGPLFLHLVIDIRNIGSGLPPWLYTRSELTNWILLSTVIAMALTALAFNRWRRSVPETFQGLLRKGRIFSEGQGGELDQAYLDFLEEYQRVLLSKKRYLLIGALMLLTSGLLFVALWLYLSTSTQIDPIDLAVTVLKNAVVPLIWAYFAGAGAWAMGVTGLYIRKLTSRFALAIQPSHPDKCGGLKLLGDFCFGIALPILIGTVFLGVYGVGGVFDRTEPLAIAANVSLVVFALPLAFVAFFAPMWCIHSEMLNQKKTYQDEFADRVAKLETKIRASLDSEEVEKAKSAKEEIEIIQVLHPDRMGYPVWPFDRGILLKFLTPQIVPVFSLALGLSNPLAETLRSIVSILSGR